MIMSQSSLDSVAAKGGGGARGGSRGGAAGAGVIMYHSSTSTRPFPLLSSIASLFSHAALLFLQYAMQQI